MPRMPSFAGVPTPHAGVLSSFVCVKVGPEKGVILAVHLVAGGCAMMLALDLVAQVHKHHPLLVFPATRVASVPAVPPHLADQTSTLPVVRLHLVIGAKSVPRKRRYRIRKPKITENEPPAELSDDSSTLSSVSSLFSTPSTPRTPATSPAPIPDADAIHAALTSITTTPPPPFNLYDDMSDSNPILFRGDASENATDFLNLIKRRALTTHGWNCSRCPAAFSRPDVDPPGPNWWYWWPLGVVPANVERASSPTAPSTLAATPAAPPAPLVATPSVPSTSVAAATPATTCSNGPCRKIKVNRLFVRAISPLASADIPLLAPTADIPFLAPMIALLRAYSDVIPGAAVNAAKVAKQIREDHDFALALATPLPSSPTPSEEVQYNALVAPSSPSARLQAPSSRSPSTSSSSSCPFPTSSSSSSLASTSSSSASSSCSFPTSFSSSSLASTPASSASSAHLFPTLSSTSTSSKRKMEAFVKFIEIYDTEDDDEVQVVSRGRFVKKEPVTPKRRRVSSPGLLRE
ncbi:hypothetical protein C8F04DRAFT_1263251 [Mycena alexandri]|uniref:Uncharacterized protein n=1 Tax=Mycena alexandri TaxID=1745969 RepID=A0AAD6SNY5_9AGAR|nr:hypothetical protein C8F04DRAFT_1263251 [Mycena alexandri]